MAGETTRIFATAAYPEAERAREAIRELVDHGFSTDDIAFLTRDATDITDDDVTEAEGEAAVVRTAGGAAAGGIIGGLLGTVASLAIPGVGPVLSAGFLAAAGGAIVGGFAGLMSSTDLSDDEVRWYRQKFEAGHPIVIVKADERYMQAIDIMKSHQGESMPLDSLHAR